MLPDQVPGPIAHSQTRTVRRVAKAALLIVAAYLVLKIVIVVFALAISLLATVATVLFLGLIGAALYALLRPRFRRRP